MSPEQLRQLREALPTYPAPAASVQGMDDYCRFYNLDFRATYPDCQHLLGTVTSGPCRLAMHSWQRDQADTTLLLVHGYFDHSGLYGKLVDYGLQRGFNVVIFDLPGHGLSTGQAGIIDDFAAYGRAVAAIVARANPREQHLWVMGQSTGCAALVEYARSFPWPFKAAVLLAPLVRPRAWNRIQLVHSLIHPFVNSVPRQYSDNSSDLEFLEFMRRDPLQSREASLRWIAALRRWLKSLPEESLAVGEALVVQGDRDGTVDWRYNINVIIGLFPGSRVEYIAGAGHHLANESLVLREQYYSRIDEFIKSRGLVLRDNSPPG